MSFRVDHAEAGVALAFLQRCLEDRAENQVAPLEVYQAVYPGYEEVVAREYGQLLTQDGEGSCEAGGGSLARSLETMLTLRNADAMW